MRAVEDQSAPITEEIASLRAHPQSRSTAAVEIIFDLRVRRHMKRLFVSQSLVEVESLKELLGTDDILCTIRNQQGSSLAGEVPFVEVFPELWVVNDADFDRAKELLEEQGSGNEVERPMWVCAGCGEKHVGLFTACWKCGRENNAKSEVRAGMFPDVKE